MKYEYIVGKKVEEKKVVEYKNYSVLVAFKNHRDLSKYVAGVINIKKSVKTDTIKSASLSKSFKVDYTLGEVKILISTILELDKQKREFSLNTIITDLKGGIREKTKVTRDIFNLKDDEFLISLYVENIGKIASRSIVKAQNISIGGGLMIAETVERTKLKIDYGEIKPQTIPIMFALEYVALDEVGAIIKELEKEY